jgi:hypothetical protein
MRVKMKYEGGALGLFGYFLLLMISFYLFFIPGAWGLVAFYSYVARNTRLSDGSAVSFLGKPVEFLKYLLLLMSLPLLLTIIVAILSPRGIGPDGQPYPDFVAFLTFIYILCFVWAIFWGFKIFKWVIGSVQFSWGGRLTFNGSIWGYIGWLLLTYVSAALIIAPFWVASAMLRWMGNKTSSTTGERLIWTGSGWALLWHTVVVYLVCMFIIPIPWAMRWFLDWILSCIEIERTGVALQPQPGYPPPGYPQPGMPQPGYQTPGYPQPPQVAPPVYPAPQQFVPPAPPPPPQVAPTPQPMPSRYTAQPATAAPPQPAPAAPPQPGVSSSSGKDSDDDLFGPGRS